MGLEQAYLAIDRAPYTGYMHTCLLVVALDADPRDVVKMSHSSLACQARISRRKAQEAMKTFEAAGILTRFRFRDKRNPSAIWFQFHRAALFAFPRQRKIVTAKVLPQRVCGIVRGKAEKRLKATIDAAARESAERIKLYQSLGEPQRLAFLQALRH